jgi:hypothetical protein
MPGEIVTSMRLLADHPFMKQSVAISKNRYGLFPDVARFLFYAKYGTKESKAEALYALFEKFSELDKNSVEYKDTKATLDCLERCFPSEPGNYRHLEKHSWVLAVFTMIYELRKNIPCSKNTAT